MNRQIMFVDCPACLDEDRASRCGLPAEVMRRFLMNSTDGPLESATIRCPAGHFFNGPVEFLTYEKSEAAAGEQDRLALPTDRGAAKGDLDGAVHSAGRDRGLDKAAQGHQVLLTPGRADELQRRGEPGGPARE